MAIKCLLKWRQTVGWQCSTEKKKGLANQINLFGFDASESRKPPGSFELCLRTCKLLKIEEIHVSKSIHPLEDFKEQFHHENSGHSNGLFRQDYGLLFSEQGYLPG